MKHLIVIISTILLLITGCSVLTENHLPLEDIEEIKSGFHSNYPGEDGIERVITSNSVFEAEWEKVYTSNTQPPEVPNIDFENRMVVLIMLDHKPTGGYGIDEVNLKYNHSEMIVGYSEVEPGSFCGTIQVETKPYVFISIPKLDFEVKVIKDEVVSVDCSD
jgi:hypothetical protein